MDFKLFLESNVNYLVPANKRELMYDFYMLQMLYKTPSQKYQSLNKKGIMVHQPETDFRDMDRDGRIDYQLEEVARKLIPALKKELLDTVYFSIASEFRHVGSSSVRGQDDISNKSTSILGDFSQKSRTGDRSRSDREVAHDASKAATSHQREFVSAAREIFKKRTWDKFYGGEQWAMIANGWLNLDAANSIPEMMVQIDHIYDLQHNTGSVFDKSDSYRDHNTLTYDVYGWINRALDHKAEVKSPMELIQFVSSSMRRIALPAIHSKFGDTYEKSIHVNEKYRKLMDVSDRISFSWNGLRGNAPNAKTSIARAFLIEGVVDNFDDSDMKRLFKMSMMRDRAKWESVLEVIEYDKMVDAKWAQIEMPKLDDKLAPHEKAYSYMNYLHSLPQLIMRFYGLRYFVERGPTDKEVAQSSELKYITGLSSPQSLINLVKIMKLKPITVEYDELEYPLVNAYESRFDS